MKRIYYIDNYIFTLTIILCEIGYNTNKYTLESLLRNHIQRYGYDILELINIIIVTDFDTYAINKIKVKDKYYSNITIKDIRDIMQSDGCDDFKYFLKKNIIKTLPSIFFEDLIILKKIDPYKNKLESYMGGTVIRNDKYKMLLINNFNKFVNEIINIKREYLGDNLLKIGSLVFKIKIPLQNYPSLVKYCHMGYMKIYDSDVICIASITFENLMKMIYSEDNEDVKFIKEYIKTTDISNVVDIL